MFLHRNKLDKHLIGQYPPIYYRRLSDETRTWRKWFAIFTPFALLIGIGFVYDVFPAVTFAGPILGTIWVLSVISALASRQDSAVASVLPYFPKKAPRVEADTFLSGHEIARRFQTLELWAREHDLTPLSTFGWNDDLSGEMLVWHDAALGLTAVAGLLENSDLPPKLREELVRLEDALRHAQQVGTPFCLLLRQGNSASGAEMEARQGNFGWSSHLD